MFLFLCRLRFTVFLNNNVELDGSSAGNRRFSPCCRASVGSPVDDQLSAKHTGATTRQVNEPANVFRRFAYSRQGGRVAAC